MVKVKNPTRANIYQFLVLSTIHTEKYETLLERMNELEKQFVSNGALILTDEEFSIWNDATGGPLSFELAEIN